MASNKSKKAALKKILNKDGASPTSLDNGLGKTPLTPSTIGSGNGSNLGTNGVF